MTDKIKIIIIGSGDTHISIAQNKRLIHSMEIASAGIAACGASMQTASIALKKLAEMDFSHLEKKFIIDSCTVPFIDESATISKKEWKKLAKKIKKQKNKSLTQAEIWGNKWNKKLKRKL